jgi:hypothetical protein
VQLGAESLPVGYTAVQHPLIERDDVDMHPRPMRWQQAGSENRPHGLVGFAQHVAGSFGCFKQFLRDDDVELDPGVGVGATEVGRGIPVLGFKLIRLHPAVVRLRHEEQGGAVANSSNRRSREHWNAVPVSRSA